MKRRVPVLSQRLARRIVTDIRKGIPSVTAARRYGVDAIAWGTWMTRKGRTYRDLQAQVDQAEAQAEAVYERMLLKAGKRGKVRAALAWLQARAPQHFPPSRAVNVGTMNSTIIEQIKLMEAREGQLPDPRRVLCEAQECEQAALPPAPETPEERVFEVNGESRPGVLEMVSALAYRPRTRGKS